MFTGLISEMGTIKSIIRSQSSIKISIRTSKEILLNYKIGDSMSINGVCLTCIKKSEDSFMVEIMPVTFNKTTFTFLKVGSKVNLERSLLLNMRLEGHLVSGHVDSKVKLLKKQINKNALILTFEYPRNLKDLIIPQGSVAINGVSLTVVETTQNSFSISLIPHSRKQTNLDSLNIGEFVNIETDIIGKYLKKQKVLNLEGIKYE